MTKRLTAKVGEYQKDGHTKGRYVDIGVILSNSNGEYMLLDPTVNLAGVLMQQRILAQSTGKKVGDRVVVSIFDNSRDQGSGYTVPPGGAGDLDDSIPFAAEWR